MLPKPLHDIYTSLQYYSSPGHTDCRFSSAQSWGRGGWVFSSISERVCTDMGESMCVCLNASAATLPMSSADQANQQLPVCIGWAREPVGAPNKKLMHEPPHQQLRTISDSLQKHPDSECQVLGLMGERERESKGDKVRERERESEKITASDNSTGSSVWTDRVVTSSRDWITTAVDGPCHPCTSTPIFGTHSMFADKWTQGRDTSTSERH